MSARNVDKYAERGSLLVENWRNDDLSIAETMKLLQMAGDTGDTEKMLDAIATAFYMGYAAGYDRRGRVKRTTAGDYKRALQAAGN